MNCKPIRLYLETDSNMEKVGLAYSSVPSEDLHKCVYKFKEEQGRGWGGCGWEWLCVPETSFQRRKNGYL